MVSMARLLVSGYPFLWDYQYDAGLFFLSFFSSFLGIPRK